MSKKLFNIEELMPDDDSDVFEDFDDLSEEELKKLLPTFTVNKLADIVVTSRYIGLFKNLAVDAMQELSVRRIAGDTFAYETYIEDNLNSLPKLNFNLTDMSSIFESLKGFKK